jgi:hypothetical protein
MYHWFKYGNNLYVSIVDSARGGFYGDQKLALAISPGNPAACPSGYGNWKEWYRGSFGMLNCLSDINVDINSDFDYNTYYTTLYLLLRRSY